MKKATKQLRKMTEDEKEMVEENERLVHYIVVNSFKIHQNSSDYEDIVSIGIMGLIKAAQSFNKEKKTKFATYASTCIKNEIIMDYRKNRKYLRHMHIEDTIKEDEDGNKFTLENILEDPKANFIEKILEKQKIAEIMNVILNCFKPNDTIILLYYIIGKTQNEIGEILHMSQSYISRIQRNSIKKIRYVINSNIRYKNTFSITIEDNKYQIKFQLGKIGDVEEFLSKILSVIDLKGLLIKCDNNEVTIIIIENLEKISIFIQIYDVIYKNYPKFFDEIINYNNKRLRGI